MQKSTIKYDAPLCRHPGCNRHVWSMYCADHRDSKINELQSADPRALSISDKRLLRDAHREDNEHSQKMRAMAFQVLPNVFDREPTVDEMEYAAMNIVMSASTANIARTVAVQADQHRDEEDWQPSFEDDDFGDVPFVPMDDYDAREVREASERFDFFGQTQRDASMVASFLTETAWSARISRGDKTDAEGLEVPTTPEEAFSLKRLAWTNDGAIDDYIEGLDGRTQPVNDVVVDYLAKMEAQRQHDSSVADQMRGAQSKFGSERLNGYTKTPAETVRDEQKAAYSECETTQMYPLINSEDNETKLFPPVSEPVNEYTRQSPNQQSTFDPEAGHFIHNESGTVFNAKMEKIGSILSPEEQAARLNPQSQQQSSNRIPDGMVRQRDNSVSDPRERWRNPESAHSSMQSDAVPEDSGRRSLGGSVFRGIARAGGATARMGWDVGTAIFQTAVSGESEESRERRLMQQGYQNQAQANRAIIDQHEAAKRDRQRRSWW